MGAWIEIIKYTSIILASMSHPTMGAWIEIVRIIGSTYSDNVAPHDGCVD